MDGTFYLVDNNALIVLKKRRFQTEFFVAHCRVTTDVLREASERREQRALRGVAEPMTPGILEKIRTVMSAIDVGDTALVDLYGNKGAADPGLIATILDCRERQDGWLIADEWVLVTLDRAVIAVAARYQIPTMAPAELAALIDASVGEDG